MKDKKCSIQLEFSFDRRSKSINTDQNYQNENIISFTSSTEKKRLKNDVELVNYVLRNTKSF